MPSASQKQTTTVTAPVASTNEQLEHPKDSSLTRTGTTTSNQTTSGNKTPQEYPEFIKQALVVIEKKVRNLEKRRTKLEEYQDIQKKGTTLNEDQLSAVSKYDEVRTCLDMVKELDKQLNGFAAEALKAQKKQAKKEQLEREELVRDRLREVQKLQSLLNTFGDERVRQNFLGSNTVTKEELDLLDEFDKLTHTELSKTYENDVNEVVDHYLNLVESKNKQVLNTTYGELRKLFDRLLASSYWTTDHTEKTQSQSVEHEQTREQEQKTNVNTSTDDYVMVTSTEVNELVQNQESVKQTTTTTTTVVTDQLYQVTEDQSTFFTTLNRPDNSIKEILNENNEGLNFLQDSQIYPQTHEQQQEFQQNDDGQHQHGFKQRGGDGSYQQRNNGGQGGYQRRPYNNDNGDNRRTSGGGRGGFGGRGGNRGGFNRGGNNNGGNFRGGYRGKPRNPEGQYNREGGHQQNYRQQHQQSQQSNE